MNLHYSALTLLGSPVLPDRLDDSIRDVVVVTVSVGF
jgi:hypothetical protein